MPRWKRLMDIVLYTFVGLIAVVVIYFFILGQLSKSGNPPGLEGDQLAKCPNKPNCVCSEYSNDSAHAIAPIDIAGVEIDTAKANIKVAMESLGGKLQTEDLHYLAYTFNSALFGFVDDVEVRIDPANNALHLRSASRVGYSDLGANRKRAEAIKAAFASQ